jgi:hypothetical protein
MSKKFIFELKILTQDLKEVSSILSQEYEFDTLAERAVDNDLLYAKSILVENLPYKLNDFDFYGVKHKPTKTWVFFRGKTICLTASEKGATVLMDKRKLRELIIEGSFNGIENYGRENLLEFEIKKIKNKLK